MATEPIPPAGDDPLRLVRTARSLLAKGGVLESTAGGEQIDDGVLRAALERQLREHAPADGAGPLAAQAAAAEVVGNARRALERVAAGESATSLSDAEVSSLEAIVLVTGRPAARYLDGRVQMPAVDLGENDRWRVLVATARSKIDRASASVGQVALDLPSGARDPVGTAWRLGDDLVVTNRHVARELVPDRDAPVASWALDPAKPSSVDFAATDGAAAPRRFALAALVYCAPDAWVDLAVLRLERGDAQLPAALGLEWDAAALGLPLPGTPGAAESAAQGEAVYVVGHPYQLLGTQATRAVFGAVDGRKRWSPGLVTTLAPEAPHLEHDCSTLGGNSGSCVLSVSWHRVVGVHFAGLGVDPATAVGRANVAVALARLGDHPAACILRNGRVPA